MLDGISKKFIDIFRHISGKASISAKNIQDTVDEIKVALLEADVNLRVVRRFVNYTLEEAQGDQVFRSVSPGQQFVKIVYDRMVSLLGDQKQDLELKGPDTQTIILLLGLQGSGKTTTAAKLALKLKPAGTTLIPLAIYFNSRGLAKIELGLATGKKAFDKRQDMRKKDHQREMQRAMSRRR